MRGRAQTSDHDLLSRIQKRASTLSPNLQKRYYSAPGRHSKAGAKPNHAKGQSLVAEDTNQGASFAPDDSVLTKAKKPTFKNTIGLDIQ